MVIFLCCFFGYNWIRSICGRSRRRAAEGGGLARWTHEVRMRNRWRRRGTAWEEEKLGRWKGEGRGHQNAKEKLWLP
ncbi:hypothetical protein BHE74_00031871 [Ensete ventricosum]|nr:hypothetical protein GW17_00013774 [Ensete ventricosum]RWW61099.1 hypothetical protein BHE74_00031871 [Ensete ventricosum]